MSWVIDMDENALVAVVVEALDLPSERLVVSSSYHGTVFGVAFYV